MSYEPGSVDWWCNEHDRYTDWYHLMEVMERWEDQHYDPQWEDYQTYIGITCGMRGWFAVLLVWNQEMQMYEPWSTGFGSYKSSKEAIPEAKGWAAAEGIQFRL